MAKCLGSLVNKATAILTQDYQDQPKQVRTQPECWRAILRVLLSLVVAAFLVGAVVFLATQRPKDNLRQEAYSSMPKPIYPPLSPGPLINFSLQYNIITCPCFRQSFIWSNFIDFWLIYKGSKEETALNSWCPANDSICSNGLTAILPPYDYDERTSIKSPDLLTPLALYTSVIAQIYTNLIMGERDYEFLSSTDETAYNRSQLIGSLLWSMIAQQERNVSSTTEDYWNASRTDLKQFGVTSEYALGMSIHWDKYAEQCLPSYCVVLYEYPMYYKVLIAISQVGGFLSTGLVMVRLCLWPALTKTLCCGRNRKQQPTHEASDPAP